MAVFRCMVSSVFNVEPNPFHLFISIFIRTDGMSVNDGIHRDCSVYIEVVPEADFGGLRKEKRFCQYPAFY